MTNIITIMDTTLRDGEQTPGIAYTPSEKHHMCKFLLEEVGLDRVEVASARVSPGEQQAVKRICDWAKNENILEKVEVLGFCDGKRTVDWMIEAGCIKLNLLTKGSRKHCERQLGLSPEEHIEQVIKTVNYAHTNNIHVGVYLEDWSRGIQEDSEYVFNLVSALHSLGIKKVYLADTLGILSPNLTFDLVQLMAQKFKDISFEFHGHNDYGLATANALKAIEAGAEGIHVSVNGMGERAGNTSLAEIVVSMNDLTAFKNNIVESKLSAISELVETFSGKNIASNTPFVGGDVFTQTAGIHADGDAKGKLYEANLMPERFGRVRSYALGKLAGKASVDHNLKLLGISLSDENRSKLLERIVELGDKKQSIATEDLLMILSDILKRPKEESIKLNDFQVSIQSKGKPNATVSLNIFGADDQASASGDGGFDALMNAIKILTDKKGITLPELIDFKVRIPPGGKTEALVETLVKWEDTSIGRTFVTIGVDTDQLSAAMIAVEKMLNIITSEHISHG
jgi:D-citramalate synthase